MIAQLPIGSVFAQDYRIESFMAAGGMGSVYLVEQLSTSKQRALKVMHSQYSDDPKHRMRFASEARVSGRIDSDHVVEVLAAGVDDPSGLPWMVMELLRGSTLDELIEHQGRRPPSEVREMARQLRHVLKRAHGQGIVHRDLKPENVFIAVPRRVDVSFTLKVLDFGIAKWMQEAQSAMKNSQIIGSPFWMAPEQLEPGSLIGPPTDVWALGLICFFLLTGKPYWLAGNGESTSITAVLLEVAVSPMPPPTERARALGVPDDVIPPGFDAWFGRAVHRDPNQRFSGGDEAMGALVGLLGAMSVPGVESGSLVDTLAAAKSTVKESTVDLGSALDQLKGTGPDEAEMALRLARVFELSDSDRERAIEAYQRVLALRPGSVEALRGLVHIYRRLERNAELIESLLALATVETLDASERARICGEAAELREDRGELEGALEALTLGVDAAPGLAEPREALAHLLVRMGRRERAIDTLMAAGQDDDGALDAPRRVRLLLLAAELAEGDPALEGRAITALEAAVPLAPDSPEVATALAVRRAVDHTSDDPVDAWRRVLSSDLRHTRAWSELFRLHRERGDLDAAWTTADAAIGVLGEEQVDAAVRDLHAEHYFDATNKRAERLTEEAFWQLAHPDLSPVVSRAFAAVLPQLQAERCRRPEDLGFTLQELVDPGTSSRQLLRAAMPTYRVLLPIGASLDISSMPSLYFRLGEPADLHHVVSLPWASVTGDETQARWGDAEITFACGEHMAYYRHELYGRILLPTREDREAAWAPIAAVAAADAPPEGMDSVVLRRLPKGAAADADLDAWARGAELTASRAGLLLGRELDAARRVIAETRRLPGAVGVAEQLRDLALFAISSDYSELRKKLEIAIQ